MNTWAIFLHTPTIGAGLVRELEDLAGPSMHAHVSFERPLLEGAKNSKYGRDPDNPEAPGTLENFFKNVANDHPNEFLALLSKLIPRQVSAYNESTIDIGISYRNTEEVKDAMIDAGWSPQQIQQISSLLPNTDDVQIEADEGRIKKKDADEQDD
jgi:hypothetical protein